MPAHSVDDLTRSFERHLREQNKSPRTVEAYLEAVGQFAAYLRAHRRANGGRGLAEARSEDVEGFIIDLLGRHKPSTANNRYPRPARLLPLARGRGRPPAPECASSSHQPFRTSRSP